MTDVPPILAFNLIDLNKKSVNFLTILAKIFISEVHSFFNIFLGCASLAIRNAEWEDEYCSNECVVAHCKDVFADWVTGNLTTRELKTA